MKSQASAEPHLIVRRPESIYQIEGQIENGAFRGRWHFSFGDNYDPEHIQFGTLRVFNDDTLSPGAVWPLHPHKHNEVVTYCAEGEFRHADEHGKGGILRKGWVQHTTVGRGMWHSEINNSAEAPMRFIQMWFIPDKLGLEPAVQQREVEKKERTNILLALVSNDHPGVLPIRSDARVYASFLERGHEIIHEQTAGRGSYLYVLEGYAVRVNGIEVPVLGAAQATGVGDLAISSHQGDAELLLIDVGGI